MVISFVIFRNKRLGYLPPKHFFFIIQEFYTPLMIIREKERGNIFVMLPGNILTEVLLSDGFSTIETYLFISQQFCVSTPKVLVQCQITDECRFLFSLYVTAERSMLICNVIMWVKEKKCIMILEQSLSKTIKGKRKPTSWSISRKA